MCVPQPWSGGRSRVMIVISVCCRQTFESDKPVVCACEQVEIVCVCV